MTSPMPRKRPQPWMMPFLQGKCFDFALALAVELQKQGQEPVFYAVGNTRFPHHVGLLVGEADGTRWFADVRGLLNETDFLAHHAGEPLTPVERDSLELHAGLAGVAPPYKGNRDIAAARRAVAQAFPDGLPRLPDPLAEQHGADEDEESPEP